MNKLLAVIVLGLLLSGAGAHATIVEVPLPGLLGTYPIDMQHAERTASFVLPVIPAYINGASLRIAGTQQVGASMCLCGVDPCGPFPWSMNFMASLHDPGLSSQWIAGVQLADVTGPFQWTESFEELFQSATWDFLLDAEGEVTLFGAGAYLPAVCSGTVSPTADVTEAVLVIDAEFVVPTAPTTWGRVKALYRMH